MNPHYANVGDVVKHLALAELLTATMPAAYVESHAGAASYPLDLAPARTHDARQFLADAPDSRELKASAYHAILKADAAHGWYPGSPAVAMSALPDGTRMHFHDLDERSLQSILAEAPLRGHDPQHVSVHHADGLAGALSLSHAGALILLDPFCLDATHDDGISTVHAFATLACAQAMSVLWYPLLAPGDSTVIADQLPAGARTVNFWLDEPAAGLAGCGLAALNVPAGPWRRAVGLLDALSELWDADLYAHER